MNNTIMKAKTESRPNSLNGDVCIVGLFLGLYKGNDTLLYAPSDLVLAGKEADGGHQTDKEQKPVPSGLVHDG